MELNSDEQVKLFRVQKTLIQMLKDRGYLVPDSYQASSLDDFKQNFKNRDKLLLKVSKEDDDTDDTLLVIFSEEEKLTVKHIEKIASTALNNSVNRAILILKSENPKRTQQSIEKISQVMYIETFHEDDLLVNITEHELVPKHIRISDQEKQVLLKKYRVKESQLPRICQTDPVARYLGLKRGQVVKILRNSETAGKYIHYRIVF